jgi:hypothetical protein
MATEQQLTLQDRAFGALSKQRQEAEERQAREEEQDRINLIVSLRHQVQYRLKLPDAVVESNPVTIDGLVFDASYHGELRVGRGACQGCGEEVFSSISDLIDLAKVLEQDELPVHHYCYGLLATEERIGQEQPEPEPLEVIAYQLERIADELAKMNNSGLTTFVNS